MTRRQVAGWNIRWDDTRARAAYDGGWWVRSTIIDALAAAEPGRVLVIDGDVRLTAAALQAQASRLAARLARIAKPGEVVSFMLPNWHEAAVIYLAATMAGLVVNPLLPSFRERDLSFILKDCASKALFVPPVFRGYDYAALATRVTDTLDQSPCIVVVRGEGDWLGSEPQAALPPPDPDAVRMVMYTSGTTGTPKGVLHTHNSLHALIRQLGQHWWIEPGDRFLVPSPISHIGGSIYAFEMPLLLGTQAVLMDSWDAGEAIRLMQERRITHMAGATPFLDQLLAAARAADTRLPDLKVFICGGASVPPALIREASEWFANARVSRVYGSTEVPVTTVGALTQKGMAAAADTDGAPGVAEVILGEGDEIRARGPQMFCGYLNPADEAAAFDEAGFYRTGDQGRWDGEFLTVTGRIKDLIIRNGENIAPKEIEDLLLSHPAIADIAIIGLPDAKTGERACAVIVPAPGSAPQVADLAAHLAAAGVAKFKFPERVELRDALPRNPAGKVLKHVLRAELSG